MTAFDNDDGDDLLDRLSQIIINLEQSARKIDNNNIEAIIAGMTAKLERQLTSQMETLIKNTVTAIFSGTSGGQQAGIGSVLSAILPRLANGGIVDGATSFAIGGEAGPEAVLPLKRMADGKLGVLAEASNKADPAQIHLTINQSIASTSELSQTSVPLDDLGDLINRAIDDAIDTRLVDHNRQGGIYGRLGSEK